MCVCYARKATLKLHEMGNHDKLSEVYQWLGMNEPMISQSLYTHTTLATVIEIWKKEYMGSSSRNCWSMKRAL